jgi:hypothetical protein
VPGGKFQAPVSVTDLDDPVVRSKMDDDTYRDTRDQLEMLDGAMHELRLGRPDALAAVLEKLRHSDAYEIEGHEAGEGLSSIEHMSYDLMVRERIRRLADGESTTAATGAALSSCMSSSKVAVLTTSSSG